METPAAHAAVAAAPAADGAAGDASQSAAMGLSFAGFCRMLEAVERTPKGDAKLRLVFSDALRQVLGGGDMYPMLRLVLPQLDRERTYKLEEKKIAKVFAEVLCMAPASKDAQKLERFNDPTVVQSNAVGDFAAVLFEVLQGRSMAGNGRFQHTLGAVNALLDALVRAEAHAARKQVFMRLVTEFPAVEQKWIVRILLKDLKVGLRYERVLRFLHPDAPEMYNHTNDLHKVCTELRNSSVRYVPKIEPFQFFSPMLAKRVDFGECTNAIAADAFVMEPKLDGERVTCHVQDRRVQLISRNGTDYTDLYGPAIVPHILSQLTEDVDCILDGEMMVWDNLEYRLREFGLLKGVAIAMKAGEATHRWLCYVVWDVVYLGGGSGAADRLIREVHQGPGEVTAVMGLPLHVRRTLLVRLVKPLDHRIVVIEQTLVDAKTAKERHEIVMAEVDRQVSNGGEGVILKDVNSHYMCGESSRKTKKWVKLKPDYAGMSINLDVIILGGFYGTGRRRSGDVSVFLLGVLSRSLDEQSAEEAMKPGAPCPVFYTLARVGTGYNLDELEEMRRELEPHWQVWDDDAIPPHLNGWKPQRNDIKPDVWIDPRHSKILEVYGFELTFSNLYQTGLTIRFPRCKAIRNDKEWFQCMTVQELNATRGSLSNKRAADVALGQKRLAKRVAKKPQALPRAPMGVLADYSQPALEDIQPRQDVFQALEFCVLPGKYEAAIPDSVKASMDKEGAASTAPGAVMAKQSVEKLLHAYGASIVQNPIAGTTNYVVAASDAGLKVANLKRQGMFDIVRLDWVVRCVTRAAVVPAQARDFVFMTETTRETLAKEYDRFGDHFTRHSRPEELRALLHEAVAKAETPSVRWQEALRELPEEEAAVLDCKWTFLSHCVVYFDRLELPRDGDRARVAEQRDRERRTLLEQRVRLHGGEVASAIDARVTHVVVASRDEERVQRLAPAVRLLRRQQRREPPVVTREWVDTCVKDAAQAPVTDFFVPV